MPPTLADTLQSLIDAEIERRQREGGLRTYEQGYADGREAERATLAAHLHDFAAALTNKNTPTHLEPNLGAPTSTPAPTAGPLPLPPAKSGTALHTKQKVVIEYLARNPGAKYNQLNQALPEYTASAVYRLKSKGIVVQDEEGGFWLKSHVGAPHATSDQNHH